MSASALNHPLSIRPASDTRFDLLALGEVLLRFDPGETRIHTTCRFNVWEGGGEYKKRARLSSQDVTPILPRR